MRVALKSADLLFNSLLNIQDNTFYNNTEIRQSRCHIAELNISSGNQSRCRSMGKRAHIMETYAEMEQHFQQLNADLISSTKEDGES
jgi:hypothetical protein